MIAEIVPFDDPPDFANVTLEPPAVKLFPAASFAWSVRVTAAPDKTVPLATLIKDVAGEMPPGFTVIVGKVVEIEDPPMVACRVVAVPERTPVKFAV